ncbi:MAG: hypothetical protein OD918_07435 [Gammaproteobacteria bacterium]
MRHKIGHYKIQSRIAISIEVKPTNMNMPEILDIATLSTLPDIVQKLAWAFMGVVGTYAVTRIRNRRALFTYTVFHNRIATSGQDRNYGTVKVTLNDAPVERLFLSTLILTNTSAQDFTSVIVHIIADNTPLLGAQAAYLENKKIISLTDEYAKKLHVTTDAGATDAQLKLYATARDYLVPVINRGQSLVFEFLNMSEQEGGPKIKIEILHKGVICKYREKPPLFHGEPRGESVLTGIVIGFALVAGIAVFFENLLAASFLSFFLGLAVIWPGAYAVKAYRKIRAWLVG